MQWLVPIKRGPRKEQLVNQQQGHGCPRLTDACEKKRLICLVKSHRRPTVAQITGKVNAGYNRKMSEHHGLLYMWQHGYRLVRVLMLTPVYHWKCLQWALKLELDHGAMDEGGLHKSHFLLQHVDGWVCVCHLPMDALGDKGRYSVMLWANCWETLVLGIHVDFTLSSNTYLNIITNQVHYHQDSGIPLY